jgi:hypothetical protein
MPERPPNMKGRVRSQRVLLLVGGVWVGICCLVVASFFCFEIGFFSLREKDFIFVLLIFRYLYFVGEVWIF